MVEIAPGTHGRNDPGNVKRANSQSNVVLDKGDREASLKTNI
jgi:hypothetical protein